MHGKIDLQDALLCFNKGKGAWWGWEKVDKDGNRIPNDQRMTYENIKLLDPTATIPSKADVDAKIKELEWSENRRVSYPHIKDQLDKIYHDGIDAWKADMIKPVKDKYPKE